MRNIMWHTKIILWLAILLAGLLSACQPSPTPTPTPTPTAPAATGTPGLISEEKLAEIRAECQARSATSLEEQARIPEGHDLVYPPFQGLIYVEDQVVITGPPARIRAVTGALEVDLELMDEISLEYLEMQGADLETLSQQLSTLQQGLRRSPTYVAGLSEEDSDPRRFPSDLESLSEMVIQLYQIPGDKTVVQLVCETNGVSAQAAEAVFSDPNYHLSPAGWDGGGSPWTQNGNWAEMLQGGGLGHAPASGFLDQWALKPAGIELFDEKGSRQTEYMGDNIRVGVFDTSPFPDEPGAGPHVRQFPFPELMGMVIGQSASAEPPLTVWHYDQIPAQTCPGPDRRDPDYDREKQQDISNHGLFVSGLVHAVAPHSEIHLVRVLENDGCGNLYSIAKGLHMFMDATLQDRGGTLRGTVMNLSLGVHRPAGATERFKLPEEVVALQSAVSLALDRGAVVVAAAGNDSYDSGPTPSSMEIPANESGVLGVAATNVNRGRGCFSNEGDIAAPGGDGVGQCEVPKCDENNPEACLVSVIQKPESGYAYWVGTSFATPLISGLAALVLEQGGGTTFGTNVHDQMRVEACPASPPPSDPHLGAGIINVPHTLSGVACP